MSRKLFANSLITACSFCSLQIIQIPAVYLCLPHHLFCGYSLKFCDLLRHIREIERAVPFPSVRDRRQIWAICLKHNR